VDVQPVMALQISCSLPEEEMCRGLGKWKGWMRLALVGGHGLNTALYILKGAVSAGYVKCVVRGMLSLQIITVG
jgi:hypothetical protein